MKASAYFLVGLFGASLTTASACMLVTGDYQIGAGGSGTGGNATGGAATGGASSSSSSSSTSGTGGSMGGTGGTGGSICPGPPCSKPADCPAITDECADVTCNMGCCDSAPKAEGAPAAKQVTGDCATALCTGGMPTGSQVDDTDAPAAQDDCHTGVCDANHMPAQTAKPKGTACTSGGGKVCADPAGPNAGKCVACVQDGDCAAPTPLCDLATNTCSANLCTDKMKDGTESDVDCGGTCAACANGKTCNGTADCSSAHCAGGICCNTACTGQCAIGCGAPGTPGTCTFMPKGHDGAPSCGAGNTCDGAGTCTSLGGLKAVGTVCTTGAECFNSTCSGHYCKLKNGDACQDDLECTSGLCSQGLCKACAANGDCASQACSSGVCKLPNQAPCASSTECGSASCLYNFCIKATGAACMANAECLTGRCTAGLCALCVTNADCASGKCIAGGQCAHASGEPCTAGNQCASGVCTPTGVFSRCQ